MPTVADIADFLRRFAPPELAADWDNTGLLLGDTDVPVRRAMTCLTVTPESAGEAIAESAQLIVSHHPILFRAVQRLTSATPEGRLLLPLVRAGVAVYSPHTSFDNCVGGINDLLARALGLQEISLLRQGSQTPQCKIVVFVPDADLQRVSDALFTAGAGNIGHYSQCSFRLSGTGTFFGSEAANPTVGQKGRREEVAEWRLEVICPEKSVTQTVAAMRRAHSYEEPAFDVYPLRGVGGSAGEGRIGLLAEATSLQQLAGTLKGSLKAGIVQMVGDPSRLVRRVAIACGAGASFLGDAAAAGADVLLTGEARFHDCLTARERGLALLLPGHYASERAGVEELARKVGEQWPELEVWASHREQDPLGHV